MMIIRYFSWIMIQIDDLMERLCWCHRRSCQCPPLDSDSSEV